MTAPHDLDRQLDAFLQDGPTELPDPSFDAVRDRIETTRQRVVIGPWRMPDMNKFVPFGLGTAAVVVALVVGIQFLRPPEPAGSAAVPSASPRLADSDRRHRRATRRRSPRHPDVDAVADWPRACPARPSRRPSKAPTGPAGVCRPVRRSLGLRRHDRADHGPRRAAGHLVGGRRRRTAIAPADRIRLSDEQGDGGRLRRLARSDRLRQRRCRRTSTPWGPGRWCRPLSIVAPLSGSERAGSGRSSRPIGSPTIAARRSCAARAGRSRSRVVHRPAGSRMHDAGRPRRP